MIGALFEGIIGAFLLVFRLCARLLHWLLRHSGRFLIRLFVRDSDTFGSARWAKRGDMRKLLGGRGLIIGKSGKQFLRYNDSEGTAMVFAPSRSGKGVGVVIPNLLDYQGSVVCTDPKGENYAITARYRQKYGDVFCINLAEPEQSSCFNPMDSIRKDTLHEADDARNLALLMMSKDKQEASHWRDKSVTWLTAFILYVLHARADTPELCNLTEVRRLTREPAHSFRSTLEAMQGMPQPSIHEIATEILTRGDDDREASGILSTMEKATGAFSADRPLASIASRSDFRFDDMNSAIKSVYIVIPEESLEQYLPYMRLVTGLAISALIRESKTQTRQEFPPLLMLDEIASLGYLDTLEKGIGYIREYARAFLVFQDISQLRDIYPKADSIIANTGCQIYFGVNEVATAELMAKRIGHTTIKSRSEGLSQANDAILQHQQSAGKSEASRWLIDPAEITRMARDECIIFISNLCTYPIKAKKLKYFSERYFKGKFDKWR